MVELKKKKKTFSYYHPYYTIDVYSVNNQVLEVLTGITDIGKFNDYLRANYGEAPIIPDSVQFIANRALQNIANMKSIVLPKSLLDIGESSFRRTGLNSVDFSGCSKLRTIGNYAFYDADFCGLIDLSLCENLWLIGDYAFGINNCIMVNLPSQRDKMHIGEGAFSKRNGGNAKQVTTKDDEGEQVRLF